MDEYEGKPYCKTEDLFGHHGDTLTVLMGLYPHPWEFTYDSDDKAASACTRLRKGLQSNEQTARRLAQEFSAANMRAYLGQFLPRQGIIAFNRSAELLLDRFRGLRELTADGREMQVHIEDMIHSTPHWQQQGIAVPTARWDSPIGRLLLTRFGLDPIFVWATLATIRDSNGPDSWEQIDRLL